ncbi:MAG TPA: DeoR/GlpR family DNA-binding transcription regulator [Acidobacteriota bacterium]|nr:DeoR/GlpR family DNA-binding transcription regulator [Acidobacteriota bacterium]
MKAAERQLRIQELLAGQEFVDIETLCRLLQASESTVRRDLTELEKGGVLRRVHGGALSLQSRDDLLDFNRQSVQRREEKQLIGKAAAGLVEDEQTLILDGGSTVAEVARNLMGRRLQIVTNSLPIAEIFSESRTVELTLTGGYLYPRLRILLGPFCERMLASVSADVLIMGIGGITESGLSNNNSLIVHSECQMINVSRKVIIVADHTKFGRKALVHLAPLEAANVIVTDAGIAPEFEELIRIRGIELVIAS